MANHLAENKPAPERPTINRISNMIDTSAKGGAEEEKKEETKVE